MKKVNWSTYEDLRAQLTQFQGFIEVNSTSISKFQAENAEHQEKVNALQSVLKIFDVPSEPAPEEKKAVVTERKGCGSGVHTRKLSYALARDRLSDTPILEIIRAYEESAPNGEILTIEQLFHAVNARRTKKVRATTFNSKLRLIRISAHKELSSIFSSYREGRSYYVECNPKAVKRFKKIARKAG